MAFLAATLASEVGLNAVLLSSTAPRAQGSTKAFLAALGRDLPTAFHPVLWSGNNHRQDNRAVLALIDQHVNKGVDTIILMTHLEYSESIPWQYARQIGSVEESALELRYFDVKQGEAVIFNRKIFRMTRVG